MNDFTKEELQDILETYEYLGEGEPNELETQVMNKIQSMIDNYCEHKSTTTATGKYCQCDNCGNVL